MIKHSILFLALVALLLSCKKKREEEPIPATETPKKEVIVTPKDSSGELKAKFQTVVGTSAFAFNTDYVNSSGETFRVSEFRYYLSNFVLTKEDGSEVALPNTYFLLDASKKDSLTIPNIPKGNYKTLTFTIGVDSTKSKSGAFSGDLDPINAMFWEWIGYTYVSFRGTSPASTGPGKAFDYDIKGWSPASYYAIQEVTQNFGTPLKIENGFTAKLKYEVDILEFFKNPNNLSIASKPKVVDAGDDAMMVAKNYKDMFKLVKAEN